MENSLTVVPGLTPHVTASRPRLKAPASLRPLPCRLTLDSSAMTLEGHRLLEEPPRADALGAQLAVCPEEAPWPGSTAAAPGVAALCHDVAHPRGREPGPGGLQEAGTSHHHQNKSRGSASEGLWA